MFKFKYGFSWSSLLNSLGGRLVTGHGNGDQSGENQELFNISRFKIKITF